MRTAITRKPKRHCNLTPEVVAEVNQRADATVGPGRCEDCGGRPDFRGLQIHHIKPKGMGGSHKEYQAEDLARLCGKCHSRRHGINEI